MEMPGALLARVDQVSNRRSTLERYIVGGELEKALRAVGDVHFRSAIDHLVQARQSNDPSTRLRQATASLQEAYFFFGSAARQGVLGFLREALAPMGLARLHRKSLISACLISVLYWFLGESLNNRRTWIDRADIHLIKHHELMRDVLEIDTSSGIGPHQASGSLATLVAFFTGPSKEEYLADHGKTQRALAELREKILGPPPEPPRSN
jgi:hypothetical protein